MDKEFLEKIENFSENLDKIFRYFDTGIETYDEISFSSTPGKPYMINNAFLSENDDEIVLKNNKLEAQFKDQLSPKININPEASNLKEIVVKMKGDFEKFKNKYLENLKELKKTKDGKKIITEHYEQVQKELKDIKNKSESKDYIEFLLGENKKLKVENETFVINCKKTENIIINEVTIKTESGRASYKNKDNIFLKSLNNPENSFIRENNDKFSEDNIKEMKDIVKTIEENDKYLLTVEKNNLESDIITIKENFEQIKNIWISEKASQKQIIQILDLNQQKMLNFMAKNQQKTFFLKEKFEFLQKKLQEKDIILGDIIKENKGLRNLNKKMKTEQELSKQKSKFLNKKINDLLSEQKSLELRIKEKNQDLLQSEKEVILTKEALEISSNKINKIIENEKDLEIKVQDLNKEIENLKKTLDFERNDKNSNLELYQNEKSLMKKSFQNKKEMMEVQIDNLISSHIDEIDKLLKNLTHEHEIEVEKINETYNNKIDDLINNHQNERNHLIKSHKDEKSDLLNSHCKEKEKIMEKFNFEIENLKKNHEKEKDEIITKTKIIIQSHLDEKQNLVEGHNNEKKNLKASLQNEKENLIKLHENEKENILNLNQNEIANLLKLHQNEKEKIILLNKVEKEDINKLNQKEKEEIENNNQNEKKEIAKFHQNEIDKLMFKIQNEKDVLIETSVSDKNNLIKNYENDKENLINHHENEKEQMRKLFQLEKVEFLEKLKLSHDNINEKFQIFFGIDIKGYFSETASDNLCESFNFSFIEKIEKYFSIKLNLTYCLLTDLRTQLYDSHILNENLNLKISCQEKIISSLKYSIEKFKENFDHQTVTLMQIYIKKISALEKHLEMVMINIKLFNSRKFWETFFKNRIDNIDFLYSLSIKINQSKSHPFNDLYYNFATEILLHSSKIKMNYSDLIIKLFKGMVIFIELLKMFSMLLKSIMIDIDSNNKQDNKLIRLFIDYINNLEEINKKIEQSFSQGEINLKSKMDIQIKRFKELIELLFILIEQCTLLKGQLFELGKEILKRINHAIEEKSYHLVGNVFEKTKIIERENFNLQEEILRLKSENSALKANQN